MDRDVKKYFKELRLFIPVTGKQERDFITNVRRNMGDFLCGNPSASYDEICNHFGTPKEVAIHYFENTDTDYLTQKIRVAILVKRAIFCVIILVAVTCIVKTGLYHKALQDTHNASNSYYEDTIE